jgi:hypothetical protein
VRIPDVGRDVNGEKQKTKNKNVKMFGRVGVAKQVRD